MIKVAVRESAFHHFNCLGIDSRIWRRTRADLVRKLLSSEEWKFFSIAVFVQCSFSFKQKIIIFTLKNIINIL